MSENKNNTLIIILIIIIILLLCSSSSGLFLYFRRQPPKKQIEQEEEHIQEIISESPKVEENKQEIINELPKIEEKKQEIIPEILSETKPEMHSEMKSQVQPEIMLDSKRKTDEEKYPISTITNALRGNFCLHIQNQSKDDNIPAIMSDCIGDTNELFTYMPLTKQIVSIHSKKCLSFDRKNMNTSKILQQPCLSADSSNISSQQFDLIGTTIKPSLNNKVCLDVKNNSNNNGTFVQLFNCNNTNAQKWFYDFKGPEPSPAVTHPTTQYAETKQLKNK